MTAVVAAESRAAGAEGWGPDLKAGALSFTFDNLGEVAELELGKWPDDAPVGSHYSATEVVPALLRRLGDVNVNVNVSFFIEGWNCDIYPDTIRAIADAGHDIGLHGWRHEIWKRLDEPGQRAALSRSAAAMRALGIEPQGFRPPGGEGSALLPALLRAEGLSYLSDVGEAAAVEDGIAHLPFSWRGVDGVFLEPGLGAALGVSGAEDSGLDAMLASHKAAMERAKQDRSHVAFVFHPFLLGKDPARMDALFELVDLACADQDLWVASCGEIAGWLLAGRD